MKKEEYLIKKDEVLLKISGIGQSFGEKVVLHNVNGEIYNIVRPGKTQGQICSILGPSGIGKTTLFEACAGIHKPDEGQVFIKNPKRIGSADEKHPPLVPVSPGTVGVVYQNSWVFEHLTVYKNLLFGAHRGGLRGQEAVEKVKYYLELFNIIEQRNHYPVQLSGGQRQRVAIAQQLLCSSILLLMDEPFSGLDPNVKNEVCNTIVNLAQTNELMTMIVVTHDVASAVAISDTIWLMGVNRNNEGKVTPGAGISEHVDLMEAGLAWHPEIRQTQEFREMVINLESKFPTLAGKAN